MAAVVVAVAEVRRAKAATNQTRSASSTKAAVATRRVSTAQQSISTKASPATSSHAIRARSRQCQREVIAWLTHYADTMYPTSDDTTDADDAAGGADAADERTSVSNALAAELAELKQQRHQPRKSRARFVALDTGVRGIVFVHSRSAAIDHLQLLYRMLADITITKRLHTRYTIRIHPLHRTCFSRPEDLYATATPLLAQLLPTLPTPQPTATAQQQQQPTAAERTFSIQLNKRGSHALFDRDAVIKQLASQWVKGWSVDLDEPAVVCVVEVCGRMAGIGVVERWQEFRKFNVRALGESVYRDGKDDGKIVAGVTEEVASGEKTDTQQVDDEVEAKSSES